MSLARRLTWTIAALTTGLLLVALTPLGAMRGIRLAVHLAYDEYLELRMVDATAMYVEAARAVLHTPSSGYPELVEELTAAQREIHRFLDYQVTQPPEAPEHERTELTIANHSRGVIAGILVEAQAALRRPRDDGRAEAGPNDPIPPAIRADMQARIQSVLDDLHGLSDQTAHEITDSHDRVFQRIRRAMLVSGCLALATLAGVVVLSLIQYRG
ncbi:MAG: hypothetical protein HY718_16145, partial [Planctomycetes bacterium]|nr:hypothetical protein [Planctomycetota bacterium]